MDKLHRRILETLRERIVADMDVHNSIIKPLQSQHILTDIHIGKIKSGASKKEKAEILLDILPSCGPSAFNIFREALRHHYEWLSREMDYFEENGKFDSEQKYISTPTLPPLLPLTVERKQKMKQLKDGLKQLQSNGYIVLLGMKGFGKSSLTASTLRDTEFVKNVFHNEVYWIKFRYKHPVDDEILIQLNRLYHLVKNIEIVPNSLDSGPLKESLIYFLHDHFCKEKHCDALLILDDVCDSKIIEAFDFQCKTLVTTDDLKLVWDKRPSVIELKDGFTEAETLGLFAKVLETEVKNLPSEAKQIHNECKGMPLLIAMFAAQFGEFKHDMKLRSDRWRYYLNSLRNKDEGNGVYKQFLKKQEAIFDMCIQQLPIEMRKRYEELVIFREDVNITPQTLEILWERNKFEVEEIMLDLCHKSLAARQWNDELDSYIYGVHDLLLCHLRKKCDKNDLIKMHKSLIEKYRKHCKDDFSKLPADNYSYSYIGYHLEQAELYDKFSEIYLDFDFIQASIIHSGLNNLLIDLNNYKAYITNCSDLEYEKLFDDLKKFLREQSCIIAEHRRKQCLDIIQIAMSHPDQGYVKDTAIELARDRSYLLYLFHNKKLGQMDIPFSEEMSTEVSTSCFTCDPSVILFGNRTGEIYLWDSFYKRQKLFSGHDQNSCIKKIIISNEGDCFLSLDDHGTVKLFRLSNDENYEQSNIAVLTPKQKQIFWKGIFTNKVHHDDSSVVFSVPNEKILDMTFAHDNSRIAACTDKGTIMVWDRFGNVLSNKNHNPQSSSYLKHITFTRESTLLHVMDEIHGVLISYCRCDKEYKYLTQYNPNLENRKIIFFRSVPKQNNSLFIVTEKKAVYVKWFPSSNNDMHSYSKQIRATAENGRTVYVCASLTNDGQYIVLADSSGFINIWNADVGRQPLATYKSRVSSLDTYWLEEQEYHIICGSENRLLHKWKFPVEGSYPSTKKRLFDANVQKLNVPDTIVTETFSNTIITLCCDDVIAETEPINGKINNLILHEEKIIYVTDEGLVNIFDIKSKKNTRVLKLLSNVELIKILDVKSDVTSSDILVCRGTDDNLRVWKNAKVAYLVENTGYVISIHKIDQESVITVTRNGVVTLWNIYGTNWSRINRVAVGGSDVVTNFSCLSYQKNFLAVLNEDGDVVLYKLQNDTATQPPCINIIEYFRRRYSCKLTCCEISENEKYLAVGLENGDIFVIDITIPEQILELCYHTSSITQLNWAPSIIEVPILLSVSSDELVWWNIALPVYNPQNKPKMKLRLERKHWINTPLVDEKINSQISTSQSVDSGIYDFRQIEEGNSTEKDTHSLTKFWRSKVGKDPTRPALLAVVELPSNFFGKVCISTDFTKFVTVDIYGSISTFTLCGYS
ncbi:unnamed protein product [Xylocopa violacea]|uniref:CARD domain-containing protein n=1 Tax=Xylocopa violacea TaxID=135666 RepID=A0ABP1N949_XYLVO